MFCQGFLGGNFAGLLNRRACLLRTDISNWPEAPSSPSIDQLRCELITTLWAEKRQMPLRSKSPFLRLSLILISVSTRRIYLIIIILPRRRITTTWTLPSSGAYPLLTLKPATFLDFSTSSRLRLGWGGSIHSHSLGADFPKNLSAPKK